MLGGGGGGGLGYCKHEYAKLNLIPAWFLVKKVKQKKVIRYGLNGGRSMNDLWSDLLTLHTTKYHGKATLEYTW